MADESDPPNEWKQSVLKSRVYAEAFADTGRVAAAMEKRIMETEARILTRLEEQKRAFERLSDRYIDPLEQRLRSVEQETSTLKSQNLAVKVEELKQSVTELRNTNRILSAVGGVALTVIGLLIAVIGLSR